MTTSVYDKILENKALNKKGFAVLIDPDKTNINKLDSLVKKGIDAKVDYFFVGGSLVIGNNLDECVQHLKNSCDIPVVLFPGSPSQLSKYADALLYLSLISGRNADLLIGQHVISAPSVKASKLEIMSTGYLVVDGGAPTTVSYISNAIPLPHDKDDIALCTAMAGEMLGLKLIYMDSGSGAKKPVSNSMIERVSKNINIPLIVGGGITDPEVAYNSCKAGANIIVVGNAIEKDINLINEMSNAVHSCLPLSVNI